MAKGKRRRGAGEGTVYSRQRTLADGRTVTRWYGQISIGGGKRRSFLVKT